MATYLRCRLITTLTSSAITSQTFCAFSNKPLVIKSFAARNVGVRQRFNSSLIKNQFISNESRHSFLWTFLKRDTPVKKSNYKYSNNGNKNLVQEVKLDEWQELKKLSLYQRLKVMTKKYWYIAIPVHVVTSSLWFGALFLMAKGGVDIKPLLAKLRPYIEKSPLPDFVKKPLMGETDSSSAVGYITITFLMFKLVAPLRYATTFFTSIYTIRYFVQRGLIKPVPSKEQIKQVINKSNLNQVLKERMRKRTDRRQQNKRK